MTSEATTSVTIDSEVFRQSFYGILNAQGDFWTPLAFESEAKAKQHIADFWQGRTDKRGVDRFKIVPVRIQLTARSDVREGNSG